MSSSGSTTSKIVQFLIALFLLVFSVLCGFFTVTDPGTDLILVGMTLAFGTLSVAIFTLLFWPSSSGGLDHRTIQYRGEHHEALVVPVSRARSAVGLGGFSSFAGILGTILTLKSTLISAHNYDYSPAAVRFIGLLLLVLSLPILVKLGTLRRGPSDLALLPDGIRLPSMASGTFVPWRVVQYVSLDEQYVHGMHQQTNLYITISDSTAIELSVWEKFKWLFYIKNYHVSIPVDAIGVPGNELKEVITQLSHIPDERMRRERIQQYSETVRDGSELD